MRKKIIIVISAFLFVLVLNGNVEINFLRNYIYATDSSSHGSSGSFSDSDSSSSKKSEEEEKKTGASVNDATKLGENSLSQTTGALKELESQGGSGTEAGTADYKFRYASFNNALYQIWGVVLVILQVGSIAGVIFAGVRYMFASADDRANLKKSMIYLVIGMVIVFGASSVVGFVTGTFKDIFKPLI